MPVLIPHPILPHSFERGHQLFSSLEPYLQHALQVGGAAKAAGRNKCPPAAGAPWHTH